jgi:hypothetical protein
MQRVAAVILAVLALVGVGTVASREHFSSAYWTEPRVSPSSVPPSPSPSPSPVAFTSSVSPLPPDVAARMQGASWRPGCPVPLSALRLVSLTYLGFDGRPHQGSLIVDAAVTAKIVRIFGALFNARFPIRKMVPVDAYGGSDDRSMADDNTSMFNCRNAYGNSHWSVHAFGRAVDINTVENPYLPNSHTILPPSGKSFVDRHSLRPGMIVAGDFVVKTFQAEGFKWGGAWHDYQHFEI